MLLVTVLALLLILAGVSEARWLETAAAATWAVLFAWRTAVSEVSGANMWPIAFVMLVLPAASVAILLVHAVARRSSRL